MRTPRTGLSYTPASARARRHERPGGRLEACGVACAWLLIALKQRVGDVEHRGAVTTAGGANVRGERIKATPRFYGAAEAARSLRTRWSGCRRVRWLGQGATPMERLARRGAARTARRGSCGRCPGGYPSDGRLRWFQTSTKIRTRAGFRGSDAVGWRAFRPHCAPSARLDA